MKSKNINTVELKRQLQHKAEMKLLNLTEKQQIALLRKKYGYLSKNNARSIY